MSWIDFEHEGKTHRLAIARTPAGVWIGWPGRAKFFAFARRVSPCGEAALDELRAPMTGRVVKVKVKAGDAVAVGQIVMILEAMKMEYQLAAAMAGTVRGIFCKEGDLVDLGKTLAKLIPASAP